MTITVIGINGTAQTDLGTPHQLNLHRMLNHPTRELTVWVKRTETHYQNVRLLCDGQVCFEGLVVRQTAESHQSGGDTRLVCYSTAGYLMELNEMNPYTYFQVSGASVVSNYLSGFGVLGIRQGKNRSMNILLVSEKESCWDFAVQFFVQGYGLIPYLRRDNYLELTAYTGNTRTVSEKQIVSVEKIRKEETLTQVYFYTGSDDYGSLYGESYTSPLAGLTAVPRKTYLHPTRSWVNDHPDYAKFLFQQSAVDADAIILTLDGWQEFEPGDAVLYTENGAAVPNLYAGDVRIVSGKSGISTIVALWKKEYNLFG